MKIHSLVLGGWYQRTTLHLTEIHDLFSRGFSKLELNPQKLKDYQKNLNLISVGRRSDYLEYIYAQTKDEINIAYYEDGLYLLSVDKPNLEVDSAKLSKYFTSALKPATSYIFSLGAPTPKMLASIKTDPVLLVTIISKTPDKLDDAIIKISPIYAKVTSKEITVYKTPKFIFIASTAASLDQLNSLVQNQIFFREFKDHLERYLNIHRKLWEEIDRIKEKKSIKGNQVTDLRNLLEAYQKTIDLIDSRINQMATYVKTRSSIAHNQEIQAHLNQLFQYKFETLIDTHSYVKDLWRMTKQYLDSALKTMSDLASESTKDSIKSLQLITAIGVTSGLLGYLSKDSLPSMTLIGLGYFALLLGLTWVINKIINLIYSNLKYKLKFSPDQKI